MCCDFPGNRTANLKSENNILVKIIRQEKINFTVVLSCLADDSKLPPLVIFKRKTLPKTATFPSGVLVRCNEKSWMKENLVIN